jgi:hypothetical protein
VESRLWPPVAERDGSEEGRLGEDVASFICSRRAAPLYVLTNNFTSIRSHVAQGKAGIWQRIGKSRAI